MWEEGRQDRDVQSGFPSASAYRMHLLIKNWILFSFIKKLRNLAASFFFGPMGKTKEKFQNSTSLPNKGPTDYSFPVGTGLWDNRKCTRLVVWRPDWLMIPTLAVPAGHVVFKSWVFLGCSLLTWSGARPAAPAAPAPCSVQMSRRLRTAVSLRIARFPNLAEEPNGIFIQNWRSAPDWRTERRAGLAPLAFFFSFQ